MSITEEQYKALNGAFVYFNKELFDGKLNDCLLNFSRKSKRTLGFFAPKRWGEMSEITVHEISLNPDTMRIYGENKNEMLKEIFSTLVHEMCHSWQCDFGKKYPKTAYHNKEWAEKMFSIGLIPSTTGAPGGKTTGVKCSHYIAESGKFEIAFNLMPNELKLPLLAVPGGSSSGKAKSTVKYKCYNCQYTLRGKAGIDITCNSCNNVLESEF